MFIEHEETDFRN